MARFSTPAGNVNSRRNATRRDWLNDIARKAKAGMVTMALDDRKGGIDPQRFESELTRRNLGFTKVEDKYHIVALAKAKAA